MSREDNITFANTLLGPKIAANFGPPITAPRSLRKTLQAPNLRPQFWDQESHCCMVRTSTACGLLWQRAVTLKVPPSHISIRRLEASCPHSRTHSIYIWKPINTSQRVIEGEMPRKKILHFVEPSFLYSRSTLPSKSSSPLTWIILKTPSTKSWDVSNALTKLFASNGSKHRGSDLHALRQSSLPSNAAVLPNRQTQTPYLTCHIQKHWPQCWLWVNMGYSGPAIPNSWIMM